MDIGMLETSATELYARDKRNNSMDMHWQMKQRELYRTTRPLSHHGRPRHQYPPECSRRSCRRPAPHVRRRQYFCGGNLANQSTPLRGRSGMGRFWKYASRRVTPGTDKLKAPLVKLCNAHASSLPQILNACLHVRIFPIPVERPKSSSFI